MMGINFINKFKLIKGVTLLSTLLFIFSCNLTQPTNQKDRVSSKSNQFDGTGGGPIYETNPLIAFDKASFSRPQFDEFVTRKFVTDNQVLATPCTFEQFVTSTSSITDSTDADCFSVLNDRNATTAPITSLNGGWGYPVESDEFYQVNTFYHINKIIERFLDSLSFAHKTVHLDSNMLIPGAAKYNYINTNSYWLSRDETNQELIAFSRCFLDNYNAFYSPADNILCFGFTNSEPEILIVQDPSVIYHEMGHAFVKLMMNQRNTTSGTDPNTLTPFFESYPYESDLGTLFYDEAGAINEGIADYFSHYINARYKIGEWALGAFSVARPMSETDDLHTAPVSKEPGERLKYPDFLQYDTGDPSQLSEDIHYAGQIVSHYLVSLTDDLKTSCFENLSASKQHQKATDIVVLLLSETLGEIGDLTAKGSDLFSEYATLNTAQENVFFTNLNDQESFLWTQFVNPPNFRRFFRIFAKNILHHVSLNLCQDYTLAKSEQLLDEYGLLLFKSYEDSGLGYDVDSDTDVNYFNFNNSSVFSGKNLSALFANTVVDEDNRRNSILVNKDLIYLDEDVVAFVFDGQNDLNNIIAGLTFEGKNINTTQGIAGTEYNNGNIKISPGEVVALSLNLKNNSNSTMAGVQVLANDWDHMKLTTPSDPIYSDGNPNNDPPFSYINSSTNITGLDNGDISGFIASHSPCIYEGFPKVTEGGVTDETTTTPGSCSYFSTTNQDLNFDDTSGTTVFSKYVEDSPQPICLVQLNDENETRWVSQDHFRRSTLALEDKDCLNNPSMSSESFNPNECLIRALPGGNTSIFGKIDPQKTWAETLRGEDPDANITFTPANTVLFEVNKWIQPGTRFNCRFRVRFTNCNDCFTRADGSEFKDRDYTGHTPFKLINFEFTVLD